MGSMRNKKGDGSPPWGPSPVTILQGFLCFYPVCFLRFLADLFPVKPSTCTVDGPNRDGKLNGDLLWRLPIVEKIDDFKIV